MYTSNQMDNPSNNRSLMGKIKYLFSGPRIIFAILGIIMLAEVVYAVKTLTIPVSPPPVPVAKTVAQSSAGRISLNATKTSVKVDETIPVSVMIDTGGHTISGVDLIVRFDPKVLEVVPGGLIKGKILDEYPLLTSDADLGLVSVAGTSSLDRGFSGTGQFASLNFRAKAPGRTSLTVDFKVSATTDSNLVDSTTSKDILGSVSSLEVEIK